MKTIMIVDLGLFNSNSVDFRRDKTVYNPKECQSWPALGSPVRLRCFIIIFDGLSSNEFKSRLKTNFYATQHLSQMYGGPPMWYSEVLLYLVLATVYTSKFKHNSCDTRLLSVKIHLVITVKSPEYFRWELNFFGWKVMNRHAALGGVLRPWP